jgi:hypothetical protein
LADFIDPRLATETPESDSAREGQVFTVTAMHGAARAGLLRTAHG